VKEVPPVKIHRICSGKKGAVENHGRQEGNFAHRRINDRHIAKQAGRLPPKKIKKESLLAVNYEQNSRSTKLTRDERETVKALRKGLDFHQMRGWSLFLQVIFLERSQKSAQAGVKARLGLHLSVGKKGLIGVPVLDPFDDQKGNSAWQTGPRWFGTGGQRQAYGTREERADFYRNGWGSKEIVAFTEKGILGE